MTNPASQSVASRPAPVPPGPTPVLKKTQEYAAERDWKGYFQSVLGKPPRETLVEALAAFEKETLGDAATGAASPRQLFAIDLGCGEGRDTLELLGRGWHVLAIDLLPEAFEHMLPRVPEEQRARLQTRVNSFQNAEIPACDLLNASFSLPFCPPQAFPEVWRKIVSAIRHGGRFAGQLFGDRDGWVRCGDTVHFTRSQVDQLFAQFTLEHLREEERDEPDSTGVKHWHVYHIVARKR